MTIIVVVPNSKNSSELAELLQKIYPNDMVITFCDPLLALKYGGNNPVDIIFAETDMRRADCFTLFGTFRKWHPDIKTIVTANDDRYKEKSTVLNVSAYLQRPINKDKLCKTMCKIMICNYSDTHQQ